MERWAGEIQIKKIEIDFQGQRKVCQRKGNPAPAAAATAKKKVSKAAI